MSLNKICLVHIPRFRSTRAVWMYNELKQLYDRGVPEIQLSSFDDVASFRVHKPQWLLDLNPNGKVPCMHHDPVIMFESGAICSYLLDQFDTERLLLTRDPISISTYYLFVSWCASTIDNLCATSSPMNIVIDKSNPNVSRPMDDVITNQKYFDDIFAPYMKNLLNTRKGPYINGAQFTAADVIIGYNLLMAGEKMNPPWISPDKHVELYNYLQILKQRPGFQNAIMPVATETKS